MKTKRNAAPVQGGTANDQTAHALADRAKRMLSGDPEALRLVADVVEALAARSRRPD